MKAYTKKNRKERQSLSSLNGSPGQRATGKASQMRAALGKQDNHQLMSDNRPQTAQRRQEDEYPVQKQANKTGLPDGLKTGMEQLSGKDLSGVRVHYNSPQPAQLNALAYTQGTNIHVAPRQEKHVPHELAHVVQQMEGRVKPTIDVGGMPVNDSRSLEKEADRMGTKANRF